MKHKPSSPIALFVLLIAFAIIGSMVGKVLADVVFNERYYINSK